METFSFTTWYPKLRALTICSTTVALGPDDVSFLEDGEAFRCLGSLAGTCDRSLEQDSANNDDGGDHESDGENDCDSDSDNDNDIDADFEADIKDGSSSRESRYLRHSATYASLSLRINKAIAALGAAAVFPKLNFSAPKDAFWIAPTRTLACTTADEVLLLIKSSDFTTFDLNLPLPPCVPRVLVLRIFCSSIVPSHEFRCWVDLHWSRSNATGNAFGDTSYQPHPHGAGHDVTACGHVAGLDVRYCARLVGVSQRDCANYYPFLAQTALKRPLLAVLEHFFRFEIAPRLVEGGLCGPLYASQPAQSATICGCFSAAKNQSSIGLSNSAWGTDSQYSCAKDYSGDTIIPRDSQVSQDIVIPTCSCTNASSNSKAAGGVLRFAADVFFMFLPTVADCKDVSQNRGTASSVPPALAKSWYKKYHPVLIDLNPALENSTDTLLFPGDYLRESYRKRTCVSPTEPSESCCAGASRSVGACACENTWKDLGRLRVVEDEYGTTGSGAVSQYSASSMPYEFVTMSQGKSPLDFASEWERALADAVAADQQEDL